MPKRPSVTPGYNLVARAVGGMGVLEPRRRELLVKPRVIFDCHFAVQLDHFTPLSL